MTYIYSFVVYDKKKYLFIGHYLSTKMYEFLMRFIVNQIKYKYMSIKIILIILLVKTTFFYIHTNA